ncbi:DUF2971 domain-containing protein [Serratia fonticola]|uniref:DUF2971 domain-containing protein n=1 Tax=Serratia fonticola TaxID=47917 RepID=UPI0021793B41|nr:DUF2971 domain-containing protein [Serratia fonticola]CAI1796064.1 Protein of uncharacterised function (DUF2971) [Serratia fonticola]
MIQKIPSRLYKYKSFSVNSLDLLVSDRLYFADPTTFNDPLDCNPSVLNDIADADELNAILHKLVKENHQRELEKAAKKIKYRGPRTLEKIETLGESEAQRLINNIAANVDFFGDNFGESASYHIKRYLLKNYEIGVLSLAKKFDCPLMWSHYADQHKGFCIGYDVSENDSTDIHPVDYKGKRFIRTQQVHDMLFGSSHNLRNAAKKEIDSVILLSKAPSWKYENEYRVINNQGLQDSQFRLSDITFGLRFKESAKFSVMRALQSRQGDIDFYEMSLSSKSFKLKRKLINLENIEFKQYPISNYEQTRDLLQMFNDLNDDEDSLNHESL